MTADDAFVLEHEALVHGIAQKVRTQFDLNVEVEDLVAFGYAGLLQARERFDPSRGVQFKTFAYYRVRGAVLDGIRKMAYLPRRAHEKLRAAAAADDVLEATGEEHAATPPEARGIEGATERLGDAIGKLTASFVIAAVGQEDTAPEQSSPEATLLRSEAKARVREALASLPERELALVRGFYFEGRQFDEVAEELGISKSWASRLHGKALGQLKKALERE